jgi:hypothetical protein
MWCATGSAYSGIFSELVGSLNKSQWKFHDFVNPYKAIAYLYNPINNA